jgi:hypothetical protein
MSWRPELTPPAARLRLPIDNLQVWEAGKAVRIGHGPATVIGETPEVRTPSHTALADTLRERGCGFVPHFLVGFFCCLNLKI